VPNSPVASGQHAPLLTIDTACHRLRGGAGARDCFAGGGALNDLLHMNRLSDGGPHYAGDLVRQTDRAAAWRLVSARTRRLKFKSPADGFPLPLIGASMRVRAMELPVLDLMATSGYTGDSNKVRGRTKG
jgi:hypothetical protein